MDAAEVVAEFHPKLPGALIALDFDGTLSPIVVDPATARPAPGAVDAVVALANLGARIAVITGRDARTVLELGGLDVVPGLTVAGLYGAETWSNGELTTLPTPPSTDELRTRLPELIRAACDDAVWIEDKRLSLVVHARTAAEPEAALAVLRPAVQQVADELGLDVHEGRDVLEIRLPGFDKGRALRALGDGAPAVLFAGDDLGDLPAFDVVRQWREEGRVARSVVACSAEVPQVCDAADVRVDGPEGVVDLLAALAVR
ncbi:MAG TPA: trehalose-phosphatase [Jatrophihabitantaceae bacterium]|nr:trehalose-phosphatase [Jatrophihabitantaceae bacterium]